MLEPAVTGFGAPASVTLMSALDTTLAVSVAMSLSRFASPPPPTTAVLVTVTGADCMTFALIVIDG